MAKTIEEIFEELTEWQEENSAERSVIAIAGDEIGDVRIKEKGRNSEVVTCVASAIGICPEIEKDITKAMILAKKYRKEKQQAEDN